MLVRYDKPQYRFSHRIRHLTNLNIVVFKQSLYQISISENFSSLDPVSHRIEEITDIPRTVINHNLKLQMPITVHTMGMGIADIFGK